MDRTFEMKKDDTAQLPPGCDSVVVGMGWTCGGSVDFDASIICLDANKKKTDLINFGHLQGSGIRHRGDNTTGAGSGDDERIRLDLNEIPSNTHECFVTVNIFSDGVTFSRVSNAYIRLCVAQGDKYDTGHVLALYPLDSSIRSRGLVFAKLIRKGPHWVF
jgi:stress response protein SCP2